MLPFSSLPVKTPHIKLELCFPSSLQSERDTVKLFFALFMLTTYLIIGHNNLTPWGDKDGFLQFAGRKLNTSGPDPQWCLERYNLPAWQRYKPQNTQKSFGTSINCITFCPVSTILFLYMARKCCLEKSPSLNGDQILLPQQASIHFHLPRKISLVL